MNILRIRIIGNNVILYNGVIGTIVKYSVLHIKLYCMCGYSVENPMYYLERVKLRENRFLKI